MLKPRSSRLGAEGYSTSVYPGIAGDFGFQVNGNGTSFAKAPGSVVINDTDLTIDGVPYTFPPGEDASTFLTTSARACFSHVPRVRRARTDQDRTTLHHHSPYMPGPSGGGQDDPSRCAMASGLPSGSPTAVPLHPSFPRMSKPATWGAAIDVPDFVTIPPPRFREITWTPGAARSTGGLP